MQILIVLGVTAAFLLMFRQRSKLYDEVHRVSKRLRFTPLELGNSEVSYSGELAGVPVKLYCPAKDRDNVHIEVGVFPNAVEVATRPATLARPMVIADPAFDARCLVQGPPREVMALLHERFRRALSRRASVQEFGISRGTMRSRYSGVGRSDLEAWVVAMARMTRHMDPLGDRVTGLERQRQLSQRLMDIALHDRVPAIRIQAAKVLLEDDPRGLSDHLPEYLWRTAPDIETRLRAAQHQDVGGSATLLEYAGDGSFAAHIRILAVKALARRLSLKRAQGAEVTGTGDTPENTAELLQHMARRVSGSLLVAVLDALAGGGEVVPLEVLQRRFHAVGTQARPALIAAAGAHGLGGARWALEVLQAKPKSVVAQACCQVLDDHATLSQVGVLRKLWQACDDQTVARQLATIIERLDASAPSTDGGLAMVEAEGELALSDGPRAGELGLAKR